MSANGKSSSSASNSVSNGLPPGSSSAAAGSSSSSSSSSAASSPHHQQTSGEDRLRELEALFDDGPEAHEAKAFSTETLLDVLLVLYNECCNSSLRKEKAVTDFIELGESTTHVRLVFIEKSLVMGFRVFSTQQLLSRIRQ